MKRVVSPVSSVSIPTIMVILCVGYGVSPNMIAAPTPFLPVDQKEIDAAIDKGTGFLLKKYAGGLSETDMHFELAIYTLIHAEVDPSNCAILKDGIEKIISLEPLGFGPETTYRVAVQTLALHSLLIKIGGNPSYGYLRKRIDAVQERIALCGQHLVDSQLANGQWNYRGTRANRPEKEKIVGTGSSDKSRIAKKKSPPKAVNTAGKKIAWESAIDITGVIYLLKPRTAAGGTTAGQWRQGEAKGDNSNTQYAVLGLIAAQKSGCIVPDETWRLTLAWFEQCQSPDGGFGYASHYHPNPYGSMTTAGIVALSACYRYLSKNPDDKDFLKAPKLRSAIEWLSKNFDVATNPGEPTLWLYYYLYGLERVGAFIETEEIGMHKWYDEGAAVLLAKQRADGSWASVENWDWEGAAPDMGVVDACFAILFLKRATQDIIETGRRSGGVGRQ